MFINEDGEYRANKASDRVLEFLKRDWPGLKIYTAEDGSFHRLAAHIRATETVTLTREAQRPTYDAEGLPVVDGEGLPVMETYQQEYREQVSVGNTHSVYPDGSAVALLDANGLEVDTIPLTLVFDPAQ